MALLASAEIFQGLDGRKQTASVRAFSSTASAKLEKKEKNMNKGDVESGEGEAAAPSPARFNFVANFMLQIIP